MQEDDVICAFADHLRKLSYHVLTASGNQGSAFRFKVHGAWKAPDLVAERNHCLLVGEGKVRARDLFKRPLRKFSDFDAMAALARDPEAQNILAEEAARRMATFGKIRNPRLIKIVPAVFAIDKLLEQCALIVDREVLAFSVDTKILRAIPWSFDGHQRERYENLGFSCS